MKRTGLCLLAAIAALPLAAVAGPDACHAALDGADLVRAEARCQPLLEHAAQVGRAGPIIVRIGNGLARRYWREGRLGDAERIYRDVLALRERTLGVDAVALAPHLNNLALLLWNQGRLADAEPYFRRALAVREQAWGADDPRVAGSVNNLAVLLDQRGDRDVAEQLYRRALALRERRYGATHPEVVASRNNLALFLRGQGKADAVERLPQR